MPSSTAIKGKRNHRKKIKIQHKTNRAIHDIIHANDLELLQELVDSNADIRGIDKEGFTALHTAVADGNERAVSILLSCKNINVNSMSGIGKISDSSDRLTPLHLASSYGFSEIATLLLKSHAKVNALDRSDRTPLFLAVSKGNADVAKILLSFGANPDITDIHGYSPLKQSIYDANTDMVRLLVLGGSTVDYIAIHDIVLRRKLDLLDLVVKSTSGTSALQLNHWVLQSLLSWIGEMIDSGSRFNDQMDYLSSVHEIIQKTLLKLKSSNYTLTMKTFLSFFGTSQDFARNPRSDQIILLRKIFDLLLDFIVIDFDDSQNHSLLTRCFRCHNYYFAMQLIKKGIIDCELKDYRFESWALPVFRTLVLSGFKSFPIDFESTARPVIPCFDEGVDDQNVNNWITWTNNFVSFSQLISWMKEIRSKPMTLKELSRIQVRKQFKLQSLGSSQLPPQLIPFLTFEDE